jgi:very-short-patch-repair endonuclease
MAAQRDVKRDAWLSNQGYRVLRFPNRNVMSNLDGVCDAIWAAGNEQA